VIMSLTILPRRVALRSVAARSTPWARQFSTVVDDTFSPVAPASAPPPPQARKGRVLEEAVNATAPRYDWTKDEIREVYNTPLMELAFQAVWIILCTHWILWAIGTDVVSRELSTDDSIRLLRCRCARL
jgi:hypothetical protein